MKKKRKNLKNKRRLSDHRSGVGIDWCQIKSSFGKEEGVDSTIEFSSSVMTMAYGHIQDFNLERLYEIYRATCGKQKGYSVCENF